MGGWGLNLVGYMQGKCSTYCMSHCLASQCLKYFVVVGGYSMPSCEVQGPLAEVRVYGGGVWWSGPVLTQNKKQSDFLY